MSPRPAITERPVQGRPTERRSRGGPRPDAGRRRLETLLTVEGEMRKAPDRPALDQIAVNGVATLIDASSVFVFRWTVTRLRLVGAHPAQSIERRAPLVRALEREAAGGTLTDATAVALGTMADRAILVVVGEATALAIVERAVRPGDGALIERLLRTYAHASGALAGWHEALASGARTRAVRVATGASLLALLAVPVPLTVLAPAEIVARRAYPIVAPVDGVVRRLFIESNDRVVPGQPLVEMEDTTARGARDLAERELAVALTRHARAANGVDDPSRRSELPVATAERDLAQARLANATAVLERLTVRSDVTGSAIIDDPDEWFGRPVRTGERVLRIIDPAAVEVEVQIAPGDMVDLPPGGPVAVHLDARPLSPIRGRLERIASVATERPDGTLAYLGRVSLNEPARLGARGVARLSGERVPLAYLLLRRPVSIVRQATGL